MNIQVNFFDVILDQSWKSSFDDYFYLYSISEKLGCRRWIVNSIHPLQVKKESLILSVQRVALDTLKCLSYLTLIIPIIALVGKVALISKRCFTAEIIKEIDTGYHKVFIYREGSEKHQFFKPFYSHEDSIDIAREIVGSKLSNYLTEGKVPLAKRKCFNGNEGISQLYFEMDEKPFINMVNDGEVDFSFLNDTQRHQFFMHLLADRLIDNWDVHNKQFGLDKGGNVVSFDKGNAFRVLPFEGIPNSFSEDRRKLGPGLKLGFEKNYWVFEEEELKESKNPSQLLPLHFFDQLKTGKLVIDLSHPILQDFFQRCSSVTKEGVTEYLKEFIDQIEPSLAARLINYVYINISSIHFRVDRELMGYNSSKPN